MATNMNNLDSTSSDSFEVSTENLGSAPLDATGEAPPEEPEVNLANEGDDWFDEDGVAMPADAPIAPETELDGSSSEDPVEEVIEDSQFDSMSIDVRRKQHEFKLDPTDENLRRTLRNGVRASDIKADNDKLKAEMTALQDSSGEAKEAQEVFAELNALASEGDYDRIVEAVLGEQYQKYIESKIEDYISYENASPEERLRMDHAKQSRMKSYEERAKEKRIKELEAQVQSRDTSVKEQEYYSSATNSLRTHELSADEVPDADARHSLNKRLWRSSWDVIKELSATRDITPKLIDAVFQRESKLSRYGINNNSTAATQDAVQKKRDVAAATAATMATSRHPKPAQKSNVDISKWDGKSAKGLLDLFR